MSKYTIKEIKQGDKFYPEKLMHIYAKPQAIYVIGNEKILNNKSIAIIGCRKCTEYGAKTAYNFAQQLAEKGINIVSGLARGIDTYSHLGAVNSNSAKGKTIAVLGSGLDVIYPPENRKLYQRILETGGAVISEYPLGSKPEKYHFPARNRIISGLSDGVLVVEAKKKSGTLITVDHALDQGKDIYAIPGDITHSNSYGTNDLIKQGAIPVTSIDDFLMF